MTSVDVFVSIAIAIITALIVLFLKESRLSGLSLIAAIAGGAIIIIRLLPALSTPVSYTHLDVYKRQYQCSTMYRSRFRRGNALLF